MYKHNICKKNFPDPHYTTCLRWHVLPGAWYPGCSESNKNEIKQIASDNVMTLKPSLGCYGILYKLFYVKSSFKIPFERLGLL